MVEHSSPLDRWTPRRVFSVIEVFKGSISRPVRVRTDAGSAILKHAFVGPLHESGLARDLVGFRLCDWLGMRRPDTAVHRLRDDELEMVGAPFGEGAKGRSRLVLLTSEVRPAVTVTDPDTFVRRYRLRDPLDALRLVAIDTLLLNADRAPRRGAGRVTHFANYRMEENLGNLLFSPDAVSGTDPVPARLYAIDFNTAIRGPWPLEGDALEEEWDELVGDRGAYGVARALMPGLREVVGEPTVVRRLELLGPAESAWIVSGLPEEWVTTRERRWLERFLVERAKVAAEVCHELGSIVALDDAPA